MRSWPAHADIREVGPRDGLQNEPPVPVAERVRLIDALSRTGLRRIEAASFVAPSAIPAMAGAEAVMAAITRAPGVVYSALVPNEKGLEGALGERATPLRGHGCKRDVAVEQGEHVGLGTQLDQVAQLTPDGDLGPGGRRRALLFARSIAVAQKGQEEQSACRNPVAHQLLQLVIEEERRTVDEGPGEILRTHCPRVKGHHVFADAPLKAGQLLID